MNQLTVLGWLWCDAAGKPRIWKLEAFIVRLGRSVRMTSKGIGGADRANFRDHFCGGDVNEITSSSSFPG
jgi:hypothetical protein